jgi:hypothetical protein
VTRAYLNAERPDPGVTDRAMARSPDGVAAFVVGFDGSSTVLGDLVSRLDDRAQQLVLWAPSTEDEGLRSRLGSRLDGVASTSWFQAGPPTAALRTYLTDYGRSFPAFAGIARNSKVISYYDASEALLTAIEHVGGDLSDGRRLLRQELARMRIQLPDGVVHLDANRQAVRDISIVRFVTGAGGKPSLEPVSTTKDVEQSYGGLLSSAPPPSKTSQPCRKAPPPPWVP